MKKKTIWARLITLVLLFSLAAPGCDRQENQQPVRQTENAPGYEGTFLVVGDSLAAGLGVAEENAWPSLLESILQEDGYDWQVINGGISGETSSGALSRMKWILAQHPDVVILETGANDGLRGIKPSVIFENILESVRILQEGNVEVVLAGMQIVQNLGADYARKFAEVYPGVASKTDCILIPFLLEGVAGEPALNQADAIHPNEEGHGIIARTVYPYALEAIQRVRQQ